MTSDDGYEEGERPDFFEFIFDQAPDESRGVTARPVEPIKLFVPAAGLQWINANDRGLWMARFRKTKAWRQRAWIRAKAEGIGYVGRARVVCELHFSDGRRRDPANWAPTTKAIVDGLVDAHVFTDDDSKHLVGPDMRVGEKVVPANIGVWVLIYPLSDNPKPPEPPS